MKSDIMGLWNEEDIVREYLIAYASYSQFTDSGHGVLGLVATFNMLLCIRSRLITPKFYIFFRHFNAGHPPTSLCSEDLQLIHIVEVLIYSPIVMQKHNH